MEAEAIAVTFPRSLDSYPAAMGQSLVALLRERATLEPLNVIATSIFLLAIAHTFATARFTRRAHHMQQAFDTDRRTRGVDPRPSVSAELMHFLGEVEVVFGLRGVVLGVVLALSAGWNVVRHYFNDSVNFTEAMFVVVIMTLAATRPIMTLAESSLQLVAGRFGGTPAAWWATILTLGPLLGSLVTEPAAMTICALLLQRKFFDRQPSSRLKYATLGLLFVNVSLGGTLTPFAAPPLLMVVRPWAWDFAFVLQHFAWRSTIAVVASTAAYFLLFNKELQALAARRADVDIEIPEDPTVAPLASRVPAWLTLVHVVFMIWTVVNAHYPVLFIGGFLFFLGFARATAAYQTQIELKTPLLVGFFLAGLVVHGGLQGWWIAPILQRLGSSALFFGALGLTAFNDNALVTYLATIAPGLSDSLRLAVVQGAVTGGGLTVIANAPNPAGQALLRRYFEDAVSPAQLAVWAAIPTALATLVFRLL
ncbi:MAG: putative Na+/H+ antiporter [Vicinamibacterales bacterium]